MIGPPPSGANASVASPASISRGCGGSAIFEIARDKPDAILELLALTFEPSQEPPGGVVSLIFAGGAAISLDVECVEARLQRPRPALGAWPPAPRMSLTKTARRGHDNRKFRLEMDMTWRLDASAADFEERFTALLATKREAAQDVDDTVRGIIEDVAARGDEALIDYSKSFDHIDLAETGIALTKAEIDAAEARVPKETLAALDLAHARIRAFHERQRPRGSALSRTRPASSSAGAGARSNRSASMCRAAPPPIPPPC